jgi:hypothetical protein
MVRPDPKGPAWALSLTERGEGQEKWCTAQYRAATQYLALRGRIVGWSTALCAEFAQEVFTLA